MEQKKLSFIIVNYSTRSLLEKNIRNLLKGWDNCEIIILDGDSPDGSADFVEEEFRDESKVILIRGQNNGLAAGYNEGLKKASGDYYVYLGTDAFPDNEALIGLVRYMDENKDVGLCTPKLVTRDGKIDLDAHRSFPTPWVALTHFSFLDRIFPKSRIFNQYSRGFEDLDSVHEIDACISHFMFVRPEVHGKIGEWDEDFFLYGEDIDFCYRVKESGFKIMYLGNLQVLHYKGAGIGRDTSKDIKNVMNTDFEKITIKGETVTRFGKSPKEAGLAVGGKRVSSTKEWMRKRISKESTQAMKIFYKKHLADKYPFFLNWIVLFGIWVSEKIRVLKALIKK
jgi:GT2 family glycosyltransferase